MPSPDGVRLWRWRNPQHVSSVNLQFTAWSLSYFHCGNALCSMTYWTVHVQAKCLILIWSKVYQLPWILFIQTTKKQTNKFHFWLWCIWPAEGCFNFCCTVKGKLPIPWIDCTTQCLWCVLVPSFVFCLNNVYTIFILRKVLGTMTRWGHCVRTMCRGSLGNAF